MNGEKIIGLLFQDSELRREITLQLEYVCEDIMESKEFRERIAEHLKLEGESPKNLLSTREAAKRLGYHPKYLLRRAKKLGLTKIYMSSRSCRFEESQVEAVIKTNSSV